MAKNSLCWGTILAVAFGGIFNLQAALDYPYEYNFVSSDPDVTGKLFLDASSSTSGTAADIGPGSYLTFDLYNGSIPLVTFDLADLNTSLDPGFSFSWNVSQITTPLDISVGLGKNDVLLDRVFQNPDNTSPFGPEMDEIVYDSIYLGANHNLLNGKVLSSSLISLTASEATTGVGGGGILDNVAFDPGTSGQWIGVLAIPEPGQIALATAFGALLLGLLAGGKSQDSLLKTFLRNMLRRMPPHRD